MTTWVDDENGGSSTTGPRINGGTIDNTPIGATTPAAGSFTVVTAGTTSAEGQVVFPARTAGRGQQAIISYDTTFNGTIDPNISIGYNLAADGTAAQAGEPQIHLAFEGNYDDASGDNKMEAYIQIAGLTGQGAAVLRPWFIQANRDTAGVTNQFFADLHQFAGKDAFTAASALDVYPTQINFVGGQGVAGNYFSVSASTAGNVPMLQVLGTESNVNAGYSAKGTGGHFFYTGSGARVAFVVNNVASSVNYLEVYPSGAGSTPSIRAAGNDTDINITFGSKGTGAFRFLSGGTASEQVRVLHTASASRYVTLTGSNGGNPTIGTSAGNLAITPAVIVAAAAGSAIGVATAATTALGLPASTTGVSSINVPHGSAPSSPVNGDMWTTTAGLFVRINGATVGPLS